MPDRLEQQLLNAHALCSARDELASISTAALIQCLKSDNVDVRAAAAFALGYTEKLSPGRHSDALDALREVMLHDKSAWVREEAVKAMGEFQTDDTIPGLVATL